MQSSKINSRHSLTMRVVFHLISASVHLHVNTFARCGYIGNRELKEMRKSLGRMREKMNRAKRYLPSEVKWEAIECAVNWNPRASVTATAAPPPTTTHSRTQLLHATLHRNNSFFNWNHWTVAKFKSHSTVDATPALRRNTSSTHGTPNARAYYKYI